MNRERLRIDLIKAEGLKLKPYTDTVGKTTIGCGRNLSDVGISLSEAYYLLDNDIDRAIRGIAEKCPWFLKLNDARQNVIVEMVFNLGIGGFLEFGHTIAAIQRADYQGAAMAMLQSKWAKQTGSRAARLAATMETGVLP